jgi:MFS family permease
MAIVRLGPSTGAMLGPVAAGALVTQGGYEVTWCAMSLLATLAVILMFTGRMLLLRHIHATRTPRAGSEVASGVPG